MAPGHDDLAPGHDDLAPGHDDLAPGHDDLAPGHDDLAPGHDDLALGHDDLAPGHDEYEMFNSASPLAQLLKAPMRPGIVTWIGLRPARREALETVEQAILDPAVGVIGDHYRSRGQRTRQVTLIQAEHLAAIASYLGLQDLPPDRLRRNIVVSGINLLALQNEQIQLGEAVIEGTGACHPCSRMEAEFGPGGYNAVRGHGGITARIVTAGLVRVGDTVRRA